MKARHFVNGAYRKLSPQDMGLTYTSFEIVYANGACEIQSRDEEVVAVVVEGQVNYRLGLHSGTAVKRDMLYMPIQEALQLSGYAKVLRFGAPCVRKTAFSHIAFADVDADNRHKCYGKAEQSCLRNVWNCIDDHFDSSRFLMGFCDGSAGGWTAWPPHEHGKAREEVYYYHEMNDGFGLQCVYDDLTQADAVRIVHEGDLISVPQGYHPNVGCPKTGIRYLFCMVSVKAEDRNFMDLNIQGEFGDKLE